MVLFHTYIFCCFPFHIIIHSLILLFLFSLSPNLCRWHLLQVTSLPGRCGMNASIRTFTRRNARKFVRSLASFAKKFQWLALLETVASGESLFLCAILFSLQWAVNMMILILLLVHFPERSRDIGSSKTTCSVRIMHSSPKNTGNLPRTMYVFNSSSFCSPWIGKNWQKKTVFLLPIQ